MADSGVPLLTPEALEEAGRDLQSATAAISNLPDGLVKQRVQTALKEVENDIQSQLWGHLRANKAGQNQQQGANARALPSADTTAGALASGGGAAGEGVTEPQVERRMGTSSAGAGHDSPIAAVLRMADNARVTPPSALHAAALALHCLLLGKGFVCTGQDDKAGAVKGFAAPVRDVPSEKVVPDKWDADNTVVSFRYRRPDSPGKVYLLKAAAAGGGSAAGSRPTQFVLGERGGTILSADVDLEPLERCSPDFSNSHDFFESLFFVFSREVLSRMLPQKPAEQVESSTGDNPAPIPAQDGQPPPPSGNPQPSPDTSGTDPLRDGPPRFAGPAGVGPTPFVPGRGGDFGGDLFPSGGGFGGEGGGGLPGPGGLLGPGHPMFGGGGGAGYMEPRFDPYGPPLPGQPWGPGAPGRGGGGRGGGRGGPAQGGPRGPPGGPDNDHLRPPSGPGNMFF